MTATRPTSLPTAEDVLDTLEVSDLLYHDLAFGLPLVQALVDRVVACTAPGGRVLVFGPQALLALALKRAGFHLQIVTFGESYLPEELLSLTIGHLDAADLESGQLPPLESYDTVVLPLVLEHLRENPELLLRTLRLHLATDGHIVMGSVNLVRLRSRARALMGRGFLPDWKSTPLHRPGGWPVARAYRFYIARELATWSQEAGYDVESLQHLDGDQPHWSPEPLSVPQFATMKLKQAVKATSPALRDHFVMTLRPHAEQEMVSSLAPKGGADPSTYPFVSVVVPSRDRAHLLPDALEGLFKQTYPVDRYEVIVLNDGSTDTTQAVIDEYAKNAPCRFVTENTGGIGVAKARNHGMRLAQGAIVAHTDDDCRPQPGWIEGGVFGFERNVAFVCGPILPDTRTPWTFFSFVMWQPNDNGTYPTSNIFYRRDVVMEEGGFNESFGVNLMGRPVWGWDSDFAWRLIRKGYQRRFRSEAGLTSHVFLLSPKRWALEGWRATMLPGVVRQVPELRRTLLTLHLFHTPDSLAFEVGLVGTLLAALTRRPAALLSWAPWLRIAVGYARPDWFPPSRWNRLVVKVGLVFIQHAVYVVALVVGSVRARQPVL